MNGHGTPHAPDGAGWSPSTAGKLVNFAVFQCVWFICVYGAADGMPWVGPIAAAVLLPINLLFSPRPTRELRLWFLAGAVGLVLDSALRSSGWISFPAGALAAGESSGPNLLLAPAWIVTLWIAFGSLLNSSLTWLSGRPGLALLLSAIGGPFSFWSGTRLGATSVPGGWMGYLALSIEYALVVPFLMQVGRTTSQKALPTRPDLADDPTATGTNKHDPRR
ncbi:MAG: DUF2878 domain-containing protein [Planctomycetota bacterium]|nr:DUF2878 domain-containing protein [Planctomycetota bacterium]MDG1985175.1 DUF2878 domain-containing protein [Planctomycetota bacterium]